MTHLKRPQRYGSMAHKALTSWPTIPNMDCWDPIGLKKVVGPSPWMPSATAWSSGSSMLTWVQPSLQASLVWPTLCRMEPHLTLQIISLPMCTRSSTAASLSSAPSTSGRPTAQTSTSWTSSYRVSQGVYVRWHPRYTDPAQAECVHLRLASHTCNPSRWLRILGWESSVPKPLYGKSLFITSPDFLKSVRSISPIPTTHSVI